jgi:hypothetical protein
VSLPSSDLNIDLNAYVEIISAILDIPVYKSKIQTVHLIFSLFSEFKNSEHFKNASSLMTKSHSYDDKNKSGKRTDQLVID